MVGVVSSTDGYCTASAFWQIGSYAPLAQLLLNWFPKFVGSGLQLWESEVFRWIRGVM